MNGIGILKGLWVTFCHFIETFLVDLRSGSKRYFTETGIKSRLSADTDGIFTIQYPEEKMPVPENFRYLPFLVYRETESGEKKPLCTACGICTKVCPPQCISIKKAIDPETGKAISSPAEFFIDIDICMNCGLCAEYCPFDAIKMDHDYEIATQTRDNNLYDLQKLMKPMAYYAKIRPSYYATEVAARREKELKKNQ